MTCHISKFANMTESFTRREQGKFYGMREEIMGYSYQVFNLGNYTMILPPESRLASSVLSKYHITFVSS